MAETSANRLSAIRDDGFVDFYQLLEVETDATTTRIRTTINTLYNEAQSNRDHRNLNRRREYQTILQVLPQARELLLDEKKRPRYDKYRDEALSGSATMSFEDWTNALKAEEEAAQGGRTAVLGIQDEMNDGVPRATVMKAPRPARPSSRVAVGDTAPRSTRSAAGATSRQSLVGSAISVIVFFVLLLLAYAIRKDLTVAILVSSIGGLIAWVATHRKSGTRTRV